MERYSHARVLAVAALLGAVVIVTGILLTGDDHYSVRAQFQTASQLVNGDEVQVAGKRIGLVDDIHLTRDGLAEVRLNIEDERYRPLRAGTQAVVRLASLAGVANRYVDLQLPPDSAPSLPDGGLIPASATTSAVDLDQLFNTFDAPTRKAFAGVVEGQARVWKGTAREADAGLLYLNPALAATNRLLTTLNHEPQPVSRFLVASSRLATDLAAERRRIAPLIADANAATAAAAQHPAALDEALRRLPPTLRRANSTVVNLRALLQDLDPLIAAAGPAAHALRPFAAATRTLAARARPTLPALSRLIRRAGADNDLTEVMRLLPAARDRATREQTREGATRPSLFESTTDALRGVGPVLAFNRPYAVDLTSWFDTFAHSGIYDATGGTGRIAFHLGAFQEVNGRLELVPPELREPVADRVLQHNQRNRCPGALERGSAYKPTPDFNCDLGQQPLGP